MAVVAFVRSDPDLVDLVARDAGVGHAERTVQRYGRALRCCFIAGLAVWAILQVGCLLSLFLHFRSGVTAGLIDGTLAFRFWWPIEYFSPTHAMVGTFVPHIFPIRIAIGYTAILAAASIPFCAMLMWLTQFFGLYGRGEIFTQRNAILMRRIGHAMLATGYLPLLLGPLAHAIGVLKPVTGISDAMIAFLVLGLMLLGISHVMGIGQRIQQDQEGIL